MSNEQTFFINTLNSIHTNLINAQFAYFCSCALYSVRGIKERKDIYIRGHRVYELTDSTVDTPCKEYPQVPTQIPGFPKPNSETPDELSSCNYDDAVKTLTADIFPNYNANSQPQLHMNSQPESMSSQQSVTAVSPYFVDSFGAFN